jgi:hypothetical protein
MSPDYKAEKKSSVTDLQGGGIWEINLLTFLAPVCLLAYPCPQPQYSV